MLDTFWSGCNYYINRGKNEHEPIGTATSMHDCGGCEELDRCTIKQQELTWEWNEDIEVDLKTKWRKMGEEKYND